jgi:hypothetical protein
LRPKKFTPVKINLSDKSQISKQSILGVQYQKQKSLSRCNCTRTGFYIL